MLVGTKLYGYCAGHFGRDSYDVKRVEAMGVDWVVARDDSGRACFANVAPDELIEFSTEETRKREGFYDDVL